jgi:aminoglycoside 6'-N-acetyltransferase I
MAPILDDLLVDIRIRRDKPIWAGMRARLWPDDASQAHAQATDRSLQGKDIWSFIAETSRADPPRFAEVVLRKYANGCGSMRMAANLSRVPFVEGIWVNPQFRRQGVGMRLIEHLAALVIARGFHEIGSDTRSTIGHRRPHGWGFSETERAVYFAKIWDISHR